MSTLDASTIKMEILDGSCWELLCSANGYESERGSALVTQISSGRSFEVINSNILRKSPNHSSNRFKVRLLEDGYECWIDLAEIYGFIVFKRIFSPKLFSQEEINKKIPSVIEWVTEAAKKNNKYLWGGTLGPDFDCSGLIQSAFASQDIWLPRDAYQQETFCQPIRIAGGREAKTLLPGDLIFFGKTNKCNHVGLYVGEGKFWHSPGIENGHNGIKCDHLSSYEKNSVASYYFSQLRGAGRVVRCHDGTTLK